MVVGQSPRTPMKHALLNKVLGREVGALSRIKHRLYRIVDLCAGNGASLESSPSLIIKHMRWLHERSGGVHALFIEKHAATHRQLISWLATQKCYGLVSHCNAKSCDVDPLTIFPPGEADYAFILNDPNTIQDFALTDEILRAAPKLTTTLSTLGCNANGIKRLPSESREGWYLHIERVLRFLPHHHDALLIKLNRDSHQWAYLLTGPIVWMDKGKYHTDANGAFSDWEQGIEMARAREEADHFEQICTELFLTQKEREANE